MTGTGQDSANGSEEAKSDSVEGLPEKVSDTVEASSRRSTSVNQREPIHRKSTSVNQKEAAIEGQPASIKKNSPSSVTSRERKKNGSTPAIAKPEIPGSISDTKNSRTEVSRLISPFCMVYRWLYINAVSLILLECVSYVWTLPGFGG